MIEECRTILQRNWISRFDYDILDRPIATHWADGAESSVSYGIGDDAFGVSRLLQNRTDENGNEWQQYSSPQGWLTTSIAPDEATTTFRYDALGQLLQSMDPDGLTTTHTYDGFGRRTQRTHPDAGTTRWTYDAAGNMTASATNLQLNRGEQTTYEYDYTRPVHIHYPQHPQNDVYYTYDSVGRLALVRDVTGVERMKYDAIGNVSLSERIIAIPTEETAYHFTTQFDYDAFGRVQQITYPDGEVVNYNYKDGLLRSVTGDASMPYIRDISYDLYGNISYIQYGNGLQTNIFYDDVHLRPRNRQTYTRQDIPLQDISYTYDGVGNITRINQSVDPFGNMGGAYEVRYTYDDQYRLTRAIQSSTQLGGYDYSMSYSPSGLVATKNCSEIEAGITYGYQCSSNNSVSPFASHRVATVFPTNTEDVALTVWNANGELTSIVQPFQDNFRRHLWNEAGQLSFFVSNEYCGYYAYDAQGNRAYKLTGMVVADQYDAGTMQATAYFDDVTLYVNPYMVVTPRGYTKHYYNGSQRIAARLGGQWRQDSTFVQGAQLITRAENLWESVTNTEDLGEQNILSADVYVGGNRQVLPACQYGPNITQLSGYHGDDMLSRVFSGRASERTLTDTIGIYFYHADHLGSSNWITNSQGQAVQYIHYMPYGELWVNQQANSYDERFKFTGKERDAESGYDYFGARFYSSMLGHWLSVDPLIDVYVSKSPYMYAHGNPLRYDMNGEGDPLVTMEVRRMRYSNTFGMVRRYNDGRPKPHQGIDYHAPIGTPILAVKDGNIVDINNEDNGDYGKTVTLEFTNDEGEKAWAFYSHLSEIQVDMGQKVKEGDFLGKTGDSGNAEGMEGEDLHLHFEYRTGGAKLGRGLKGRNDPNEIVDTKFVQDPNNKTKVIQVQSVNNEVQ